jgi:hypothetical protein
MFRPLPLITVLAIAACASAATPSAARGIAKYADDPRLGEEAKSICFASTIDGFSLNTRDTVVLHEGRDRYMVQVAGGCMDLDSAETIALDAPTNCLTPGDAIIISRAIGGTLGPQRCMITKIHKWNPKASAPSDKTAKENPA